MVELLGSLFESEAVFLKTAPFVSFFEGIIKQVKIDQRVYSDCPTL